MAEYKDAYMQAKAKADEAAAIAAKNSKDKAATLAGVKAGIEAWVKSQAMPILEEARADLEGTLPVRWEESDTGSGSPYVKTVHIALSHGTLHGGVKPNAGYELEISESQFAIFLVRRQRPGTSLGIISDVGTTAKFKAALMEAIAGAAAS